MQGPGGIATEDCVGKTGALKDGSAKRLALHQRIRTPVYEMAKEIGPNAIHDERIAIVQTSGIEGVQRCDDINVGGRVRNSTSY